MQSCSLDGRQTKAMVEPVSQQLGGFFPMPQALKSGTLFPELSKPMNGECPAEGQVCPERAAAFAAWELRLYLDTHPDCQQALKLYHQLCTQISQPNYACAFVPCTSAAWRWIDDPWPWEPAANDGRC